VPATSREPLGWWGRLWDVEDRNARRAYRRSLPAKYHWRRGVVAVCLAALIGTGLVVTNGHPVAAGVDQWWSIRNRNKFVQVTDITVRVSPAEATVPPATAAALVDDSQDAWTTTWPGTTGTDCNRAPGSPNIELTFPPARIRQLDIYAGLSPKLSESTKQYRPKVVVIRFDDGAPCIRRELKNTYLNLDLDADSKRPVSKMTIGFQDAWPPEEKGLTDLLSIGDVALKTRPLR